MASKQDESGFFSSGFSSWSWLYAAAIAFLVAVGLVVNVGSIVLLCGRKHKSMFHSLLKVRT